MSNLIKLKEQVFNLLVSIKDRPEMSEIGVTILNTFNRPLIEFSDTYDVFIKQINNNGDLFDKWFSIQLQLITELGDDYEICKAKLAQLFESIATDMTVSSLVGLDINDMKSPGMFTLLSLRIYGGMIEEIR